MEDKVSYTIYCPRCGSEMKNNSRYCMKCGNLNIDHPDNKGMVKYISDAKENYSFYEGNVYIKDGNINSINNYVSLRKSFKSCFIVNIILYLVIILFTFFAYYNALGSIEEVLKSNIVYNVIGISVSFIYIFAYELIFVKLGFSWWKALIPIYNLMLISKRVFNNKYVWLLSFVPIVGEIYLIVLLYKLGVKFGKSGILTVILPIIMILIISFGESMFDNTKMISDDDYAYCFKIKKIFIFVCLFFIIGSIVLIILDKSILNYVDDFLKNRYNEVKEIFGWD